MYIRKTKLGNILLFRIQVDFNFLLDTTLENTGSTFQYCIILTVWKSKTQPQTYYLVWNTICIVCSPKNGRVLQVQEQNVILVLRSHLNFFKLLVAPTELYLITDRKGYLNLNGYYGKKESCLNYANGPFPLIREQKMNGRATLFFSLVCLGNFTYGQVVIHGKRLNKGNQTNTWIVYVFVDYFRKTNLDPKFVPTLTEGYSFMTCCSRKEYSFLNSEIIPAQSLDRLPVNI